MYHWRKTMNKIKEVEQYAREKLVTEVTAHDFEHTSREFKMATHIGKKLNADIEVIQVASLTHDIIDKKVSSNIVESKDDIIRKLTSLGYESLFIKHVFSIIENMSYSSGRTPESLEGKIVQDADRIDAIGAIAIARAFAYGGAMNRKIYEEGSAECSIAHFYDKLLLLKENLNTDIAKEIAISRHTFMEDYLTQFHKEWKFKDTQ
jgi:uncharacterized protein